MTYKRENPPLRWVLPVGYGIDLRCQTLDNLYCSKDYDSIILHTQHNVKSGLRPDARDRSPFLFASPLYNARCRVASSPARAKICLTATSVWPWLDKTQAQRRAPLTNARLRMQRTGGPVRARHGEGGPSEGSRQSDGCSPVGGMPRYARKWGVRGKRGNIMLSGKATPGFWPDGKVGVGDGNEQSA